MPGYETNSPKASKGGSVRNLKKTRIGYKIFFSEFPRDCT